ncbi:glycophorin-C isoform X1 [Ictalurus punctatus]|uniref:Glycophorin-C isoform X1 n=1 Tax=Ictalurus punctatus TaxID=7998 RepID=A0A2D0R5K5_ICTPU|nr:glycophorin-C isoform X1 [Ictalurus punctatus]
MQLIRPSYTPVEEGHRVSGPEQAVVSFSSQSLEKSLPSVLSCLRKYFLCRRRSTQSDNLLQGNSEKVDDSHSAIFNVIIGAVIAVVVLVFICLLFVLFRYMYQHKGTYHTNEAKGSEFAETADAALQGDPALQDAMDESKKEYFI